MKPFQVLLVGAGLIAATLTGCGTVGLAGAKVRAASTSAVRTVAGLEEGYGKIYGAAFNRADANGDRQIDEFEAGPFIDVRDFKKADDDRNGKLSDKEFLAWATRGWIFGLFAQDQQDFVKLQRRHLLAAFRKLDADRNNLLAPAELQDAAVHAAAIKLELKGIRTRVQVESISEADLKAADKTGDGALSQGEFEDFVMAAWAALINPPRSTPES